MWKIVFLTLFLGFPARAGDIGCDADVNHDSGVELWRSMGIRSSDPFEALVPHEDILPHTRSVSLKSCSLAYFWGTITVGDSEKFKRLLSQKRPFLRGVRLNSPGGDVTEAMKIGRLLRRYLIQVWAPDYFPGDGLPSLLTFGSEGKLAYLCKGETCTCASACALTWFGGIQRNGRVGLHRPRPSDLASFSQLSPEEASKRYIRQTSEIRTYLAEMEAPANVIEAILSTSSSEIISISNEGVERSPSFAEWQDAACGYNIKPPNSVFSLYDKKFGQGLPLESEEEKVLREYELKTSERNKCLEKQRYNAVDRLPAP